MRHLIACCLSALVLLSATSAHATWVVQLPFEQLLGDSSFVMLASVRTVDIGAGDGFAETKVVFSVQRDFVGSNEGKELDLFLPEGLDPASPHFIEIIGAPKFIVDQRYVVFLKQGPWMLTPIANWWHGAFRLAPSGTVVDMMGACVTDVTNEGVLVGPTAEYPDRFAGPTIDGESTTFGPAPDETEDPWVEATPQGCINHAEFLSALQEQIDQFPALRDKTPDYHAHQSVPDNTIDIVPAKARRVPPDENLCVGPGAVTPRQTSAPTAVCDEPLMDGTNPE